MIHPGNSGGALVNVRGELVGINTLIFTSRANAQRSSVGIGIALAIPSRLAQFVMDDLIRFGQVIRGWLGVSVEQFERAGGTVLHVRAVAADSPAERAGLRPADLITHIDGQPIDDVRLTMLEVSLLRPGEQLAMTVERDGSSLDLRAVVGAQPDQDDS